MVRIQAVVHEWDENQNKSEAPKGTYFINSLMFNIIQSFDLF